MSLGLVIERLEKADPNKRVKRGFGQPMSYRGSYDELAFEPVKNTTVGEMLVHARSALGKTFEGYKGGDYTMSEYTPCWIAEYGCTSDDRLGPLLLDLMLEERE